MRRLALACCGCLACLSCTRPNPAFDEALSVAEGGDTGTTSNDTNSGTTGVDPTGDPTDSADTSDSTTDTDTDTDTSTDTDTTGDPITDLPIEECLFNPTPGLTLRFGNPALLNQACPPAIDGWAKVVSVGGGEATLALCGEGCTQCDGTHPLSAFPLTITDYVPSSCLRVQAMTPLGQDQSACLWGSVSIADAESLSPFVIAMGHSAPLTTYAQDILAGKIPAPEPAGRCNCEQVGQANDCCYQAASPEFYDYPFNGQQVFPGDYAEFPLDNELGLQYYFKVFQAELIHTCDNSELQTSWAVVSLL